MKKKFSTDRQRVAYHEAGHALVAYLVFGPDDSPLEEIRLGQNDGFQGHVRWAKDFDRGEDRECMEKELLTLWGGAVAEEVIYGDSRGEKADVADAKNLVQGACWLEDKSADGEEVTAYLKWLRLRTKNKVQNHGGGAVLEKLAKRLLEKGSLSYSEARKIIADQLQARANPALEATKKRLRQGNWNG
jgi:ATP-dependent Zn protease